MPRQHGATRGQDKDASLRRLRRLKGQACDMKRMVREDRHWLDMVTESSALQVAARAVLRNHLRVRPTRTGDETTADAVVEGVVVSFDRARRQ